nr:argonaute 8 [Dermatophagoides farinae]
MVQQIDLTHIDEYYKMTASDLPEVMRHFMELLFQYCYTCRFFSHQHGFYDTDSSSLMRGPMEWVKFASGFSHGVCLTEMGLSLNIHLKTSCLISPSVDELSKLVTLIAGGRDPSQFGPGDIVAANKIIRGLKIYTTHTGRKTCYTIKGLTVQKPNEHKFTKKTKDQDEGQIVSIQEYFLEKYKVRVQNYPLVSTVGKEQFIPLELCRMVDKQFLNNSKIQADANIPNELLRVSTHKPLIYFDKLSKISNQIPSLSPELMSEFKTDFFTKPIRFTGRVLDTPRQMNAQRMEPFFRSIPKTPWAFVSLDINFNKPDVENIVSELVTTAKRYKLDLSNCRNKIVTPVNPGNLAQVDLIFAKIKTEIPDLKLLFVALPQCAGMYNMVKFCGDQKYGFATQCLNSMKAKQRGRGYLDNVLLKVNGKIGGQNSIIDASEWKKLPFDHAKTMVCGIDVNHPGQTERIESSIAAVVGSYDDLFTLYTASICSQTKRCDEEITCLEPMITELLDAYHQRNKFYPQTLAVFRDGVSDGQFQYAEKEIKQIRTAFRKKVPKGKIIFIVVQKGHRTRFVLSKPSGPNDRPVYNVPSGTVVDHTIVDPSQHMFFLNSHFSQLGTSRPMKYVILENDFDKKIFNNDALQKFVFYLCHNCTRFRGGAIALPTPVRYADLCAYRAKIHVEAQIEKLCMPRGQIIQGDYEKKLIDRLNELVKIHQSLKRVLYYA